MNTQYSILVDGHEIGLIELFRKDVLSEEMILALRQDFAKQNMIGLNGVKILRSIGGVKRRSFKPGEMITLAHLGKVK
jgi:hypothetical protein